MISFLFFTILIFILLKVIVTKNDKKFTKLNPYIQTFIGLPIAFLIVLTFNNGFLIGICIYTLTLYLGLIFQEYYQNIRMYK